MVNKLKKRYFSGYHQFFRGLRGGVAKPLALTLFGIFLFTHAVAVCAELQTDQPTRQTSKTAEYTFDSQSELQAEATNWRELRSGRENAETHLVSKLEVKSQHRHWFVALAPGAENPLFFSEKPLLSITSPSEAPFAPRPPPASAPLQG